MLITQIYLLNQRRKAQDALGQGISFPVNRPSAEEGPTVARMLEAGVSEPRWTALSLACLKQEDSNLAHGISELTGKQ